MEWIEVTARSIAEAKELALDRLGVVEDELEYEIVDEARTGLFGIGRADARIRARVRPISREKPADRRRRSGRGRERRSGDRDTNGSGGRSGSRSRSNGAGAREHAARQPGARPADGDERPGGSTGGSGNRRRRRRSGGGNRSESGEAARGSVRADERVEEDVEAETVPVEAQAERAADFTAGLVEAMGFRATVSTEIDEDDVLVRIEGENLGVLVGPRGATLQAIEELVRAVAQHTSSGHSARVHVDVAGYRERRRAALAAFAEQIASEVRESGAERALEPMGSSDRKVVHDTVADLDGVMTISEGEEPRRRVVIRPE